MRRSDLAYRLIPYLKSEFDDGNIEQSRLIDEQYLREILSKEANDFITEDLKITHRRISEALSVAIYIFPEPLELAEAKLGLLFFDYKNRTTKYYTLEAHFPDENGDERFMIGSTPEIGRHRNHGFFDEEPSVDNFVNYIYNRFEKRV